MSAAAVIIIIKPPRLSAMQSYEAFCDQLEISGQIGAHYNNSPSVEPENLEDKLLAIVNAMCGNSAAELYAANSELWPLPA